MRAYQIQTSITHAKQTFSHIVTMRVSVTFRHDWILFTFRNFDCPLIPSKNCEDEISTKIWEIELKIRREDSKCNKGRSYAYKEPKNMKMPRKRLSRNDLDSKRGEIEFESEVDLSTDTNTQGVCGKVEAAKILFETRFMPLLFSLDTHYMCTQICCLCVFTLIKRRGRPVFPICVTQLHSTSGTTLVIACVCVVCVYVRYTGTSRFSSICWLLENSHSFHIIPSHHITSLALALWLFLYPFRTQTHTYCLLFTGTILLFSSWSTHIHVHVWCLIFIFSIWNYDIGLLFTLHVCLHKCYF